MSSYEAYEATSRHYDVTRRPVGSEIILGMLAGQARPLGRLELLDAGCGTGNYVLPLLAHVGRIVGVDGNTSMLERAAEKLSDPVAAGRVTLMPAELTELPFEDASFDAVMVNQVLHHLADEPEAGWSLHRRVLGELVRVLRPGGTLLISTTSQEQLRQGYWYYELIRAAAERLRRRYIPLETLAALLAAMGLTTERTVPLDAVMQGDAYFDPLGPLEQSWRDGDSGWALASIEERDEAIARVRQLAADGRVGDFLAEHDKHRPAVGQVTVIAAVRR
jgi:SAM-dependent methyltransferase